MGLIFLHSKIENKYAKNRNNHPINTNTRIEFNSDYLIKHKIYDSISVISLKLRWANYITN